MKKVLMPKESYIISKTAIIQQDFGWVHGIFMYFFFYFRGEREIGEGQCWGAVLV